MKINTHRQESCIGNNQQGFVDPKRGLTIFSMESFTSPSLLLSVGNNHMELNNHLSPQEFNLLTQTSFCGEMLVVLSPVPCDYVTRKWL